LVVDTDGEMKLLNGGVKDEELEQGVSRSSIDLVRWWLYDTYDDVDDDLNELDNGKDQVGPFSVLRPNQGIPSLMTRTNTSISTAQSSVFSRVMTPREQKSQFQIMRNITQRTNNSTETMECTNFDILADSQEMRAFIDLIPLIFDTEIQNQLSNRVKLVLGRYILDESPLDRALLLSVITVTILYKSKAENTASINKAISFRSKILTIFQHEQQHLRNYESFSILMVLMIMINTTLGIYDPQIFNYEPQDSLMSQYYKFFKATDILINPGQFSFCSKFSRIYADMLDPNYNLLKNLKEAVRLKHQRPLAKIDISISDTPKDRIIKVPRHIEEVDDDNEPAPPTFTVHFSNDDADKEDNGEEEEDDDANDEIVDAFRIDVKSKEVSVYGISQNLVFLYSQICQLMNHKRYFRSVNMNSRNFAKVLAEFEDLLVRQGSQLCHSPKDEQWYHLLLIIYFRAVLNYPCSRLKYHYSKAKEIFDDSPSSVFVHTMLSRDHQLGEFIWQNNWKLKEWHLGHQDTQMKEWIYADDKPEKVFVY
jgi:hypothetical protein